MGFSVIQIPMGNNGPFIQNNVLSPSAQNAVFNLIIPNNRNCNTCGDNFFDNFGNNWRDWDDDVNNGNYVASGLNSPSPFIRNFFRNVYNGGDWNNWNTSGARRRKTRRFKRKMKELLSALLLMCTLQGNNVSF